MATRRRYKGPNQCRIIGDDALLTLEKMDGSTMECVISVEDIETAAKYRLVVSRSTNSKVYCQRLGAPKKLEMFGRVLLGASDGQSVRFANKNSLDLRRSNLSLMDSKSPRANGPNAQRTEDGKVFVALQRRDGSPAGEAIFDDHMAEEIRRWRLCPFKKGYAMAYTAAYLQGATPKSQILAHHLVTGKPPAGMMVDHINRNRLDNRAENLRFCTKTENTHNACAPSTNTSGFKNVLRDRTAADGTPRWIARVTANGVMRQKYGFRTPEAASEYATALRALYHGAFACHE